MTNLIHSSIHKDDQVFKYISQDCKFYYLPLFKKTYFNDVLQKTLGCCNDKDRTWIEIESSLLKAKKSRSSHIKIPIDRIDSVFFIKIIEEIRSQQLGVVLQVAVQFLKDKAFLDFVLELPKDCVVEIILNNMDDSFDEPIKKMTDFFNNHFFSIMVVRELNFLPIVSSQTFKRACELHIVLTYQQELGDEFLNCKESHKLIGLLRKKYPEKFFLPPKGMDIWDFRARHDFDMEPFYHPCIEVKSKNPQVRFSVIIPTYNNQNHLRVVIRHLYRQNVGLDAFELIVVDDGGTDQTQALVNELLRDFPESMNFKYIYFPRAQERVMGDSQYRAGISRNLGVKNSEGEILNFLDSDILVSQDYLSEVEEQLKTWDAIQARRINLSQPASHLKCEYDTVIKGKDTILDEPYWEAFIKIKDWHLVPYNWKYVCTHSFSLKKDVFWQVGGLKKNFIYYGFEDTDLGYRLVKAGYRLHLLDKNVYHLFHENTRSEFMNLKTLRHNLLSRTAQIFYLHHFDEDIYENLLGFMEPEPSFKRFFNRLAKLVTLQFLWKPKDKVFQSLGLVIEP